MGMKANGNDSIVTHQEPSCIVTIDKTLTNTFPKGYWREIAKKLELKIVTRNGKEIVNLSHGDKIDTCLWQVVYRNPPKEVPRKLQKIPKTVEIGMVEEILGEKGDTAIVVSSTLGELNGNENKGTLLSIKIDVPDTLPTVWVLIGLPVIILLITIIRWFRRACKKRKESEGKSVGEHLGGKPF
jgi:hypothetical protein